MKSKLMIAALFVLFGLFSIAFTLPVESKSSTQYFPKTCLAECFTATWCSYCVAAEGALDRLADEYPLNKLAIIEYHINDEYSSEDYLCDERMSFYDIPGIPITFFSGRNGSIGGSLNPDDNNVYVKYKSRIENDLQISSNPIVISLDSDVIFIKDSEKRNNKLKVIVNITCSKDIADSNLYLHVVLVDDHNKSVIVNGREYRLRYSALRRIAKESITLSGGKILSKNYIIDINPNWNLSRLHVVAFVQTHNIVQEGEYGYVWNSAKVYNCFAQPIYKWELKPTISEIVSGMGRPYELKAIVVNELSTERKIIVGVDPTTLPSGWSVEICVDGICFNASEIELTIPSYSYKYVTYRITPASQTMAYIKLFAYSNQHYQDVHYIIFNSIAVPEFSMYEMIFLILLFLLFYDLNDVFVKRHAE